MSSICPNPGCGAAYNLAGQHVGRRIACKKCGTSLVVGENGLQLAGPAPPAAVPAEAWLGAAQGGAREGSPHPPLDSGFAAGAVQWRALLARIADRPTWLFGTGLFFTILYTFFPLIDQAKVSRREAAIVAGDVRETRLDQELKKKEKPSAADEERRKKGREQWEKTKSDLEEAVEDAVIGQRRALYWYRYGMLLGVLLLAAGSLAYLDSSQPLVRRIVGAAVLVALIAVLFNSFGRFGISLNMGG